MREARFVQIIETWTEGYQRCRLEGGGRAASRTRQLQPTSLRGHPNDLLGYAYFLKEQYALTSNAINYVPTYVAKLFGHFLRFLCHCSSAPQMLEQRALSPERLSVVKCMLSISALSLSQYVFPFAVSRRFSTSRVLEGCMLFANKQSLDGQERRSNADAKLPEPCCLCLARLLC